MKNISNDFKRDDKNHNNVKINLFGSFLEWGKMGLLLSMSCWQVTLYNIEFTWDVSTALYSLVVRL